MYNGFRILKNIKLAYHILKPRNIKLCQLKAYSTSQHTKYLVEELRYSSVFLRLSAGQEYTNEEFQKTLLDLLQSWKESSKRSALIEIPISQSHLIKEAVKCGFHYHHARDDVAVLSLWLDKDSESKVPLFANHTVGVAGACFDVEKDKLLLVKDKGRYKKWWKFPGGFSDMGEYIGETAVREVYEETGIQSEFMSLLTFREQHENSFGQSDLYFICRMRPISFNIKLCPEEIDDCAWIPTKDVLNLSDTTPFVKIITKQLVDCKGDFKSIDISSRTLSNFILKGKKMVLYYNDVK